MRSIAENAKASLRARAWQDWLSTDPSGTAEAIVLGYLLDGWQKELRYRLGYQNPYRSEAERQGHLVETIGHVNWLLTEMAKDIPEGQSMICEEDRQLFSLIRDAGLDLASQRDYFG